MLPPVAPSPLRPCPPLSSPVPPAQETVTLSAATARAKVALAANEGTRRLLQSVSAPSLTRIGTRPRPDRVKVDLRRQSPLVALYKQIQLDAMAAATAADQGAASTRLLGLARSSSHIRFADTSPAPNEEPPPLLETIRRHLSCDSLSPTDAACACVSSHTSSALGLGQAASPLRYAVDADGGAHALATQSLPCSKNRLAGCAGFRPSQPSSPARTEAVLRQWREEKRQDRLAQRALQASLSQECERLEAYREKLLRKPKPILGGCAHEFAAKRAGGNHASRSPGVERAAFRGDDGVDKSFMSLVKAPVLDGKRRIHPK